jgi:anti-sigma regulatory factor (Ser/Thr protein kinase)
VDVDELSDVRFELDPGPGAPRAARRRVVDAVLPWDGVDVDVVALLTSELVTNVVLHADSPARVHVRVDRRTVRVEVSDDDPGVPELRSVPRESITGRGLRIVDVLSDRWGVRPDGGPVPNAKTVWFELDRRPRP